MLRILAVITLAFEVIRHGTAAVIPPRSIRSCEPCLAEGYGWCPLRRRCGGFQNKQCSGTDSDLAVPMSHFIDFKATATTKGLAEHVKVTKPGQTFILLFHQPAHVQDEELLAAFEDVAWASEGQSTCYKVNMHGENTTLWTGLGIDTFPTLVYLDYDKDGLAVTRAIPVTSLNSASVPQVLRAVKLFRSGRIATLDSLADLFMSVWYGKVRTQPGQSADDIIEEASAAVARLPASQQAAGEFYIFVMEEALEKGISFIANAINKVSRAIKMQEVTADLGDTLDLSLTIRKDILSVFVKHLFDDKEEL